MAAKIHQSGKTFKPDLNLPETQKDILAACRPMRNLQPRSQWLSSWTLGRDRQMDKRGLKRGVDWSILPHPGFAVVCLEYRALLNWFILARILSNFIGQ